MVECYSSNYEVLGLILSTPNQTKQTATQSQPTTQTANQVTKQSNFYIWWTLTYELCFSLLDFLFTLIFKFIIWRSNDIIALLFHADETHPQVSASIVIYEFW